MRREHLFYALVFLFIAASISVVAYAQRPMRHGQQPRRLGRSTSPMNMDAPVTTDPSSVSRRMIKASYEEMTKDAEQLSNLASDLEEEVRTSASEDTLSLATIKKAQEIEKLAKKIQSRMKNL